MFRRILSLSVFCKYKIYDREILMDYYCKIEKELQPFINLGDYEIIESNEFFIVHTQRKK